VIYFKGMNILPQYFGVYTTYFKGTLL